MPLLASTRLAAVVTLIGGIVAFMGFFLPLLAVSGAGASAYRLISEWQLVTCLPSTGQVECEPLLLRIVAAVPILAMLITVGISIAALVRNPLPGLVGLHTSAIVIGFLAQVLVGGFAVLAARLIAALSGTAPDGVFINLGLGLWLSLIGFLICTLTVSVTGIGLVSGALIGGGIGFLLLTLFPVLGPSTNTLGLLAGVLLGSIIGFFIAIGMSRHQAGMVSA